MDLASSLVQGTPENSDNLNTTANESIVDKGITPEEYFRDIIDAVINNEEGFGEDYLHSTAFTLIENSTYNYLLPQKYLQTK